MRQSRLNGVTSRNIKKHRNDRGWSQEELADRCGHHRTYIGAIERGERNITLQTLERISAALSVLPKELFLEAGDE